MKAKKPRSGAAVKMIYDNSQCFNGSLASRKTRKHRSGFYDKLTSREWVLIDFETTINSK